MEEKIFEQVNLEYSNISELRREIVECNNLELSDLSKNILEIIEKYNGKIDSNFYNLLILDSNNISSNDDYLNFIGVIDQKIAELDNTIKEQLQDKFEESIGAITDIGLGISLIGGFDGIAYGKYAGEISNITSSSYGIALAFDYSNVEYIKSIIASISNLDQITLKVINNEKFSKLIISSNKNQVSVDSMLSNINTSIENVKGGYSNLFTDQETLNMIKMVESFVGKTDGLTIALMNNNGIKKFFANVKDPNILRVVQEKGIKISDAGNIIFDNPQQASEFFLNSVNSMGSLSNDMYEINSNDQDSIILPGQSKVDFYEKDVTNEFGEQLTVRLSVVKQNKNDSNFERLANITYINKATGEIASSTSVYTFDDAYKFDSDVLPELISLNGLSKNSSMSGRNVEVDDSDPTKCYFENDNYDRVSNRYSFDNNSSMIDMENQHNIFGNSENVINASSLKKDKVIDIMRNVDSVQFENDVINNQENEVSDESKLEYNKSNKVMEKKLGEYPRPYRDNENGNVNFMNLMLFLTFDVIAIITGLLLLLN